MEKRYFTSSAYNEVVREVHEKGGSATSAGKQYAKENKGLHPMVDPAGNGVIRRSITRFVEEGGKFIAKCGIAIHKEDLLDTTGSMKDNVDKAFYSLPRCYALLTAGKNPVLGRYDVQMATSIFGDVSDDFILGRTQFEMDEKIAEQMTLLVPEGKGDDSPEDPHYGLFGAAYLTAAAINSYGLKGYHFHIGDETAHPSLLSDQLIRVFGKDVFEKCAENGFQIQENDLPSLKQIVADLLKKSHAFFLQVGSLPKTTDFWAEIYGSERIVKLPRVEVLSEVQAAIIGLTEGVWDLQSVEEHLIKECDVDAHEAARIVKAVAGIPIGEQMKLENFSKIPPKGSVFINKTDLWPVVSEEIPETEKSKEGKKSKWL